MTTRPKIRLLRVVTAPECVPWHLGATLTELAKDFDVFVVGHEVSRHARTYPGVTFVDVDVARKLHPLRDLQACWRLYRLMKKWQPDIAHSIMPKAGLLTALAARAAGVGVRMHTFTGQVWDTKQGIPRLVFQLVDRLIVALNSTCLTDSPSQSQHLFEHGICQNGRPLHVLGKGSLVGVDLNRFNPDNVRKSARVTRESLGLSQRHFVVAYIARKSPDKGALDMIKGFALARAKAPHLRLLFIGPDECQGLLDAFRRSDPGLWASVIERDTVDNHEDYLCVSNVLCMPSHREGFGSVVIDAAALGIPCVGSDINGLRDSIVDGTTGLLFPAGDHARLAQLLLELDENRELLAYLGKQACRRAASDFSTEIVSRHLSSFYLAQCRL